MRERFSKASRAAWIAAALCLALAPAVGAACGVTINVKQDGTADAVTITAGLAMLPASLAADECLIVRDNLIYPEQVGVNGFVSNGFRLTIMADPTFISSAPVIRPPLGSTAAFVVASDSVTLARFSVSPISAAAYGVLASSGFVSISSVNISDPGGKIWLAGMSFAGPASVDHSSVAVLNAYALRLSTGSDGDRITQSTFTSTRGGQGGAAAFVVGASSAIFVQDYFQDFPGIGLYLLNASSVTVAQSAIASANLSPSDTGNDDARGLLLNNASSNTITQTLIFNSGGSGVFFRGNSSFNTISRSTVTSNGPVLGAALMLFSGPSRNQFTQDVFTNLAGAGVELSAGSNFNAFVQTTMTDNADAGALLISGSSATSVSQSVMLNTGGPAAVIAGGFGNSIADSTLQASTGAIVSGSTNTTITSSVLTAATFGASALMNTGGSGLLTVGSDTFTVSAAAPAGAIAQNGASGPIAASGPLTLRGDLILSSGVFQGGAFVHILGQNLNLNIPSANFQAPASTFVFDGSYGSPPVTVQTASITAAAPLASFNALVVKTPQLNFTGAFTTNLFDARVSPSTITFLQAGPPSVIGDLEVHGLGTGGSFIDLACAGGCAGHTGNWPLQLVAVSSVTGARISDCDASFGLRVDAGDGGSVDLGRNANWLFSAQLAITLPGQTYVTGVGNTGAPLTQTAGAPFPVTVYAVTTASGIAGRQFFDVTLNANNPYGFPASGQTLTQTLVNGATNFLVSFKTAEPVAGAGFPTLLTSSAALPGSLGVGVAQSTAPVGASTFVQLQLLLPNESPLPGSPSGKQFLPDEQITGVPLSSITVRAVDSFFNLVPTISSPVVIAGTTFSSATWPAGPVALIAGSISFVSTATVYSTGTLGTFFSSVTNSVGVIADGFSAPFFATLPSLTSPTVNIGLIGSTVATVGSGLAGGAGDSQGVNKILVSLQSAASGPNFFYQPWPPAPGPGTFANAIPVFGTATLTAHGSIATRWSISLPDADLVPAPAQYLVTVKAINTSGLVATATGTFTFNPGLLNPGAAGGQGSAVVVPAISSGCEPVVATVTFTVGAAGLQPGGGGLALQVPRGWTIPVDKTAANPPPLGYVVVASTSAAMTAVAVSTNPARFGGPSGPALGSGWVSVMPQGPPFLKGEKILITYAALPPLGPAGRGPQIFTLLSQSASGGSLSPVLPQPSLTLNAGTTNFLAFTDRAAVTLGPLQNSPTMQLALTDLCGNQTSTNAVTVATLSAVITGAAGPVPDAGAVFYLAGGGPAVASVAFAAGSSLSPPFYFATSTGAAAVETLVATAAVPGRYASFFQNASRQILLAASSPAFVGVSLDTGTPSPGVTVATASYSLPRTSVFLRFNANLAGLPWEAVISTDAVQFSPPVFRAAGLTDPARSQSVAWDGLNNQVQPQRYVAPGVYYVRLRLSNGAAENTALRVHLPVSPFIAGNVGAGGAGADVRADGPGSGLGNNAVATSTGYFQVFGLIDKSSFNVTVSTTILAFGQAVRLQAKAFGVPASTGGTMIAGGLTLPATGLLRVSVALPTPAPRELTGSVAIHDSDYTNSASAALHFFAGFGSSDDGAGSFGGSASTWTAMLLLPGQYTVDIKVPDLALSTSMVGVSVGANAINDLPVALARKSNVYGFAMIPSTSAFPAPISLSAQKLGAPQPSVFAQALVHPWSDGVFTTSAPYTLFGLDPGSWTITARAFGFFSSSTAVLVSTSAADLGDPSFRTGGVSLALSSGGLISGTLTFSGSTAGLSGPSCPGAAPAAAAAVPVQAYNLQTAALTQSFACVVKGSAPASSTFTIGGLDSGSYLVTAQQSGFILSPAGGASVVVSTPAVSTAAMTLTPTGSSGAVAVVVRLPPLAGGVCRSSSDFQSVGLGLPAAGGGTLFVSSATSLTPVPVVVGQSTVAYADAAGLEREQFFCSSMTLTTPPPGGGFLKYQAIYGPTGAAAAKTAPLVPGSMTTVVLDLAASTYTVSGRASFAGLATLPSGSGGFAVSVSSIAGLFNNAPKLDYCLLSSTSAVHLSTFRLELVPYDSASQGASPGLCAASVPAACSDSAALNLLCAGRPLLAYAAPIAADGTFAFPGVPAGDYVLRNVANLDGIAADGPQISNYQSTLHVSSDTSGLAVPLAQGVSISGTLLLPAGLKASRQAAVVLQDPHGGAAAIAQTGFANGGAAVYRFENVADGSYALVYRDLGSPRMFAARPLPVTVAGAALAGQDIALLPGGTIKATIGIQRLPPSGPAQTLPINAQNQSLLPAGLVIDAVAAPWFAGGFYFAEGAPGGLTLDANGQAVIADVLPGAYDVEFNVPSQGGAGGVGLVSTRKAGVTVGAGQTVDLGVVALLSGTALSGQLTDAESGAPAANVLVAARPAVKLPGQTSQRSGFPSALTDQAGRYAFSGLDPTVRYYDLFAAARLNGRQGDALPPYEQSIIQSLDLQSTSTLNIALTRAPYALSGRVLSLGGELLYSGFGQDQGSTPGAALFLQKVGQVPVSNPVADIVLFTDAQGAFTIPSLTAGTYRLTVTAQGYQSKDLEVALATSTDLGALQLQTGASLSGALRKSDGSAPGEDEIGQVVGATPDMTDFFFGALTVDPVTRGVTGYRLSGFQTGVKYRLLFLSSDGQQVISPPEAANVVFTSSRQVQQLDILFKPPAPFVVAKDRRSGSAFNLVFQFSQPLRAKTADDSDLTLILTTAAARGTLSSRALSDGRQTLTAAYAPAVDESSFTLHVKAFTSLKNPDSLAPVDNEFVVDSTAAFFVGIDGANRATINNLSGGGVVMEGDPGRVTLPKGAFGVDAAASVTVLLQKFSANTDTSGQQKTLSTAERAAANLKKLSFAPSAYPAEMVSAVAALPQAVSPLSGFYDVLLPLGVRTALSRPTPMTIAYSTGIDPSTLNLYWYNAAANAYVLQQDAAGAQPVIDRVNHTITINVNHFSTFVLFNTGVEVITGNAFSGGEIKAYNFPNPFDLSPKVVNAVHGGACAAPGCSVRGTMISISVPADVSGESSIRIFNVAGERVRTLNLGPLLGGSFYYQEWDGRSDFGRDVASGVYIAEVKIGGRTKFFKMVLMK